MTITFACGHTQPYQPTETGAPLCHVCGMPRVAAVRVPAPVFRGACSSPLKETTHG